MCLGASARRPGGSITRPASYCGVAGCKPTYGRVSTDGVMPLAASMDHPGPMARCVRDLAILLQAIAGSDPRDPLCSDQRMPDLMAALAPALTPPRLGRVRGLFEDLAEPPIRDLMDQVSKAFQTRGARVADVGLPAGFADVVARHRTVMAVEAAAFHGPRLRRHPDDYLPNIRSLLDEGLQCPAPEYARCKEHQQQLAGEVLACLDGVDALLAPAITGPAPDASTTGNPAFQVAVELHRLADRLVPGRPQRRRLAAGYPAGGAALVRGRAVPRRRLVRGGAGDRAQGAAGVSSPPLEFRLQAVGAENRLKAELQRLPG